MNSCNVMSQGRRKGGGGGGGAEKIFTIIHGIIG